MLAHLKRCDSQLHIFSKHPCVECQEDQDCPRREVGFICAIMTNTSSVSGHFPYSRYLVVSSVSRDFWKILDGWNAGRLEGRKVGRLEGQKV